MNKPRKSTIWNIIFSYSQLIIGIVNGLLFVPLYFKYIDSNSYAYWLASGNILMWISIVDPGISIVLQQRIASNIDNKKNLGKLISSGLVFGLLLLFVSALTSLIVSENLIRILNVKEVADENQLVGAFLVACVGVSFSFVAFTITGIYKGLLKARLIGIIVFVFNILGVVLNVVMLLNDFGLYSLAFGRAFPSIMITFVGFYILYRELRHESVFLKFDFLNFKSFFSIFSFTFVSKMSNMFVENIDLILVARYIGPEYVNGLEISRRPIKIAQNFINRVSSSIIPEISSYYGKGDLEKVKKVVTNLALLITCSAIFIAFGFINFNEAFLTLWLPNEKIFLGFGLNTLLVFVLLIRMLGYNFANISFSLGNIKGNSVAITIKSIVFLSLFFSYGRSCGIMGLLLSILGSILVTEFWYFPSVIYKKMKLKYFNLKILFREIIIIGIVGVIVTLIIRNTTIITFTQFVLQLIIYNLLFFSLELVFSKFMRTSFINIIKTVHKKMKK